MIQRIVAFVLFLLFSPFFLACALVIKVNSSGPFLFTQKRMGKNRKEFVIYKMRTMRENAEQIKENYAKLNESTGPVFKIRNDPRYTAIGKFLSHTGIDELPQLLNIIKGEMAFVGPRPLPVSEARVIPKKYHKRFEVLPGITSLWVVKGTHTLSFEEWMELDLWYANHKSWLVDLKIAFLTVLLLLKLLIRNLKAYIMRKT
ncbi:sugar transferase [Candidatus Roizmanbacteria bacterium]|nr:MAG: sugar transferase [Candidatus Roizmanbacteria bacterium]